MVRVQMTALFMAALAVFCQAQTGVEKRARAADAGAASPAPLQREDVQKKKLESLLSPFDIRVESLSAVRSRTTATTYREVRVRWDDRAASSTTSATAQAETVQPMAGASAVEMSVVGKRVHDGRLALQRSMEMTPEQVLVVAVDAASQLRWWTLIIDPRILRSEILLEANQVSGHVIYRPAAEFFVEIPDDPEITELRFYKPTPGGGALVLQPLGTISF